jgi:endonuclease YncB( thermonuclease family)
MIEPTYIYRVAEIVKVFDGDTYTFRLDLGFRASLTLQVRLHGYDCPELRTDQGKKAREVAAGILQTGKVVTVQSFKDDRSFERWVCDVDVDGVALGPQLEQQGLAVRVTRFGDPAKDTPHA